VTILWASRPHSGVHLSSFRPSHNIETWRRNVYALLLASADTDTDWSSDNALELYLGDARFECGTVQ
jgi:hypothetical protein